VTDDDDMPAEHRDILRQTNYTLAIISPKKGTGYEKDQWERDIIHKWAHKMEAQEPGSIRRYSLNGSRQWRLRRRPSKRTAAPK